MKKVLLTLTIVASMLSSCKKDDETKPSTTTKQITVITPPTPSVTPTPTVYLDQYGLVMDTITLDFKKADYNNSIQIITIKYPRAKIGDELYIEIPNEFKSIYFEGEYISEGWFNCGVVKDGEIQFGFLISQRNPNSEIDLPPGLFKFRYAHEIQ